MISWFRNRALRKTSAALFETITSLFRINSEAETTSSKSSGVTAGKVQMILKMKVSKIHKQVLVLFYVTTIILLVNHTFHNPHVCYVY